MSLSAPPILAACGGGASARRPRTNVAPPRSAEEPLSVEANRNAPPPAPVALQEGLVLWCSQPTGPACTAAQEELGAFPAPTPSVPLELLGASRDEADDCADPDLAPLMQRVTSAVGASTRGWTDQEGRIEDPARIADLYSGSGCTNAAAPGEPPVKIHVIVLGGEPRFLVRIWEVGEE